MKANMSLQAYKIFNLRNKIPDPDGKRWFSRGNAHAFRDRLINSMTIPR